MKTSLLIVLSLFASAAFAQGLVVGNPAEAFLIGKMYYLRDLVEAGRE